VPMNKGELTASLRQLARTRQQIKELQDQAKEISRDVMFTLEHADVEPDETVSYSIVEATEIPVVNKIKFDEVVAEGLIDRNTLVDIISQDVDVNKFWDAYEAGFISDEVLRRCCTLRTRAASIRVKEKM